MLDVNHVTKKYGKNLACDDVSFLLDNGSLTVLLGPNGAGKSTIIKSIIGFLKYDGRITVNGIPNKTSQARKIMGYIPELPSLYPTLTVIEHMEFIARAYKMTNYKERIDMLL
ncbi:MAG: ATP-binding cassette domain-containing protein, partial [Clostridiales bacterium]|nr:ATP-binding cassette domain-containing protein [Clostridiales bacterium]